MSDAATRADRHAALSTAGVRALRCPSCPIVQTGMGWVSGARLTAATSSAGGLGILASATMTLDELRAAIAKVKAAHVEPVRREPAAEPARRGRADRR